MKTNLPYAFTCFFTGLFIVIAFPIFAQSPASNSVGKRANIWCFGHQAGLDFNSGAPVAITSNAMSTDLFCSTISDNNGNLLFYTDGDTVWNKNNQMMPNGFIDGPNGSVIILPKPGDPYLFYIFNHKNSGNPTDALKYHIVDIRLDNDKGDVTYSSSPLHAKVNQQFIAVPHVNGQDYWILITESDSSYAYHLSASGIDQNPVESNVLTSKGVWSWDVSPDYTKIAVSYFDNTRPNYVKVYDFDNSTGLVSTNTLTISITDIFCLQFSPDGSKLYAGQFMAGVVYQWDLNAGSQTAIINSQTTVGFSCVLISCMRTGPDGKIYVVSNAYNNYLHCISNPNAAGSSCGFQLASVSLGRSAWNFLPCFPRDFLTKNGLNTSITTVPEFDFSVYPNPVQSKMKVSLPSTAENGTTTLELLNVMGKQLERMPVSCDTEVDVSCLAPGVYFMKIISGINSASKKFVVL